jgi:hypothetical protein
MRKNDIRAAHIVAHHNNSGQYLNLNVEQAQKQLELLGYKRGDKIFMRYIHPNPSKEQPKSIKKSRLNWEECERYQSQGYDAYFVVNGGGDTDAAVKAGRAIFYEHDNLPKPIQQELWRNLGLPEPTVQVDSGGKSIHSYWVLDKPISIEDWRELQEDLLEFADGDRSIKNPSRILRLAGCRYMKGDNPGSNIATLITASGKRYSYLELKDVIQVQKTQTASPLDSIELPVSESVPLEACLTKRSREMLASGTTAPDKKRNDSGIELARDLIGTAAYLEKIGQAYNGNPEILFFDWCRVVALDSDKPLGQPEAIWKSAQKSNPTPGSGKDSVDACIRGWHWRENIKPTGRGFGGGIGRGGGGNRRSSSSGSGGGDGGDGGDGKQPLIELSLRDRVLEILNRNQDQSRRNEAFINLAQTTSTSVREIKELAASIETEVDLEESRSDRKTEIENLLRIGKYQLELQDYLDRSVAQPLERVARWMGTTPGAMLTTLYPVIGSLLQAGTRLELIKATDFYAVPVVYTGLVCESGAGKTPAQKTIINPLFALQDEAEIEYKERLINYQQELSEWKKIKDNEEPTPVPPVPREY